MFLFNCVIKYTPTYEIYTILFVGSVRCVQETGTWAQYQFYQEMLQIMCIKLYGKKNQTLMKKNVFRNALKICFQCILKYPIVLSKNEETTVLFSFLYYLSCLLYTSPSPRDRQKSRMPSSA
eukprot:TRINITY_DN44419_c0_g1_i1.p1 TRINITY_DN44419_c0_g1~~TRINITY_DN44419_c0_g1_i1.p1  ORF type:complete len:122 (-),score=23.09 TRINITY_DN44419_c0_g1_i1:37-402(-)